MEQYKSRAGFTTGFLNTNDEYWGANAHLYGLTHAIETFKRETGVKIVNQPQFKLMQARGTSGGYVTTDSMEKQHGSFYIWAIKVDGIEKVSQAERINKILDTVNKTLEKQIKELTNEENHDNI